MKRVKVFFIVLFFILVLLPIKQLNAKKDYVSEIDNRILAAAPWDQPDLSIERFFPSFDRYIKDRIGYRSEMIYAYDILHDRLFHQLINPIYDYGKDGYIFPKFKDKIEFGEYHVVFADMIKKIQDICTEKGVTFVFVFNPIKTSVLLDYVPDYYHYDNSWTKSFLSLLDERNVNYVDTTSTLTDKAQSGVMVFNKQYDANHWNHMGAFYGLNEVLENIHKSVPSVQPNDLEDFVISEERKDHLIGSDFPIDETITVLDLKTDYSDVTAEYDALVKRDKQYPYFKYFINQQNTDRGVPLTLCFQGSYMNYHIGYKFFVNALGEYVGIHNYQNIFNFEEYFDMFEPEIVVFEVAEYTLEDRYFNYENMKAFVNNN